MAQRPLEVAVIDTAIAYRRGLSAALERAGYETAEPDHPALWAEGASALAAIVGATVRDREIVIATLAGAVTVVALLPGGDPEPWWRAVLAGADGVADRDASPEEIVTVLKHALRAKLLLPSDVVRWLAERAALPPDGGSEVGDEEAAWLRYLADGRTVAALADEVGYSERTMFRRLYEIYGRLGARNRTEAMVAAQRMGLLGEPSAGAGDDRSRSGV